MLESKAITRNPWSNFLFGVLFLIFAILSDETTVKILFTFFGVINVITACNTPNRQTKEEQES